MAQKTLRDEADAFAETDSGSGHAAGPGPKVAPGAKIGQYELIRELGRGGMGVVYAARDPHLGRRVAIKFLIEKKGVSSERFLIEARATAQCTHENIVVIHEVGEHDGHPFMVLEFLEGHTLRQKLDELGTGHMPASRVVEIVLPVARALARASALGIVHRDLKPENVVITDRGQVKVLDFGIAKARDAIDPKTITSQGGDKRSLTDGELVGTLPYMSPEQIGRDELDARSDLWSVGVMMYEMLAGQHPVQPFTTHNILAALANDAQIPSVTAAAPDTPAPLAKLVDLCLRKRKVERIANAAELARRLEELLPRRRSRELEEGESPYPGLAAFQEHDADRYFGREREVTRMATWVRDLPLTAVVGPSGVGKSSFVRAGIAPALKASGESWEIVTLRPGRQPIAALASVLERFSLRESKVAAGRLPDHKELVARLRSEPGYLGALLRARVRDTAHHILVFVDQLEELYTLVADGEERRAFTAALAGAADDAASPVRVIVSMRADFLDRVAEDPHFLYEISRGLLVLGSTDRAGLRDALVKPLELVGYGFDSPAIVEEMLDELADAPGALPLLQFVASKLWDARDTNARQLTERAYRSSGGVLGALAAHADSVLANLDAQARALAPTVFRQLVTPERTRSIAELSELEQLSPDRALVKRLLDQLVAARLIVVHTRGEAAGGSVEIVHESLIDRWPALRRWLDEAHEDAAFLAQLASTAKQWDAKGRVQGLLWRGEAMEEARRWAAQRRRPLPDRDDAFLEAVLALGRRSKRVRRAALVGAFATLGAIAAGASFALMRVRVAEQTATENADRAQDALQAKTVEEKARLDAEAKRSAALAALLDQEQRAKALQQGVLDAEQAAQAAQAQKVTAEREAHTAEANLDAAAQQRNAAVAAAQQEAAMVKMTREELVAKNQQLETALATAKAAREKAERATAKAEEAATEATKTKKALQEALAAEHVRAERLEEQKKQISTKLH